MIKKAFLVLLFSSSVLACTSPVSPPPPNLIPEKKMTGILVDIHVAEAQVENMGLPLDSGNIYFKNKQKDIFKKHKITEKEFYNSYNYYVDNVSELDKIYEKVVDSLSFAEVKASGTPALERLEPVK